jgi:Spy/CpxP family protein refolding chaperone
LGVPAAVAAAALLAAAVFVAPATAMTSHAGWPSDQHLVMDKGPGGRHHVLVGEAGKHN